MHVPWAYCDCCCLVLQQGSDLEKERAGVTTDDGRFLRYEEVCTAWQELFRDVIGRREIRDVECRLLDLCK